MTHFRRFIAVAVLGVLAVGASLAQRSAREYDQEQGGNAPTWKVEEPFKRDVFTFARIKYSVDGAHGFGHGARPEMRWLIDAPDSDLNFSFRLQQVTSIKV